MFAVLALDLEATGKDPKEASIIQIGASLNLVDEQRQRVPGTAKFSQRVSTKATISAFVQQLTGIVSVVGEEELPKVLQSFAAWFNQLVTPIRKRTNVQCILVTYNGTSYDLPLLAKSLREHGSDLQTWFNNMGIVGHVDMLSCVKQHNFYESYSLTAMHKHVYGKEYDAHDAGNDAAATGALLIDLHVPCEFAAGINAVLTDVERALETQEGVRHNPARNEISVAEIGHFQFHVRAV